jgi:hypothetical protein
MEADFCSTAKLFADDRIGSNSVERPCRLNVRFARKRTRPGSTMRIITIALTTLAALAPANAQDVRFRDAHGRVTGSARTDANGVTTTRFMTGPDG